MIISGSIRISWRPTPFQSRFERDWRTVLGWVSQPITSADADGPSLSPARGFLARPSHARHRHSYAAGHLRPRRARADERVREVRTSSIRIRRGRDPTIVPTSSSVQNDRQHSFFPFSVPTVLSLQEGTGQRWVPTPPAPFEGLQHSSWCALSVSFWHRKSSC